MTSKTIDESEYLLSAEACAEFSLSRGLMTRLLKSGALSFTTDALDQRLKWVKRSDVARLAAASHRSRRAHPSRQQLSHEERLSETDEPTYTLNSGELLLLLHAFAPYLDVAQGNFRQSRDIIVVLNTIQTFYELIEAEHRAGKPMGEILNNLCLAGHEPDATGKIQAILEQHLAERKRATQPSSSSGGETTAHHRTPATGG